MTTLKQKINQISSLNILKYILILSGAIFISIGLFKCERHEYKNELKEAKILIKKQETQIDSIKTTNVYLQDSITYYKKQYDFIESKIVNLESKINELNIEKKLVLKLLNNLPKETIDTFFIKRYKEITKSGIVLNIDKNVGNEIVKELTEKDFNQEEIKILNQKNTLYIEQIDTLKRALTYSGQVIDNSNKIIDIKSLQLKEYENNQMVLEKALKEQKRKTFWRTTEGATGGILCGILITLLLL